MKKPTVFLQKANTGNRSCSTDSISFRQWLKVFRSIYKKRHPIPSGDVRKLFKDPDKTIFFQAFQ